MKSLRSVWNQHYCCKVSRKSLGTNRIAVQFHGRVKAQLYRCIESWDQQVSCEVSMNILGTSSVAVESLERVLGTSRIHVKSLGRVIGPAGLL